MLPKTQKKRVPVRSLFHHVMRSKLYSVLTINSLEGLIHELDNLLPVEMEKDNIDPFSFENRRYQNGLYPTSHGDHLDRALKSLGKDLNIPVSIDLVNTQAVKKIIMSIARNVDDEEKNRILEWLNMPNEVIMKSQRYQDFINQACIEFYKKPASEINDDTVGFIRRSSNELLRNKASKEALKKRLMKADDVESGDMKLDSSTILKSYSPEATKMSKMIHKYDMPKTEEAQGYNSSLQMNLANVPLPVSSTMGQHMLSIPPVNQHLPAQIPVLSMNGQHNNLPLNLSNMQNISPMPQLSMTQPLNMQQSMQNVSLHHEMNMNNMTMNNMPPVGNMAMNSLPFSNMNMNSLGAVHADVQTTENGDHATPSVAMEATTPNVSTNAPSEVPPNTVPQQTATLNMLNTMPNVEAMMNMNGMNEMNMVNMGMSENKVSEKRIPDIDPLGNKRKADHPDSL